MKNFAIVIGIVFFAGVAIVGGVALNWAGEAIGVAQEEFGPREMLRKYEWFKDASAQLDAKRSTIERLRSQIAGMESDYQGTARVEWPREDRQTLNVWTADLTGAIGSFNTLAADYNAQMAKFNFAFANAGSLPKGAETPLPREFKPYTLN
jgi:uncharacterized protein YukE